MSPDEAGVAALRIEVQELIESLERRAETLRDLFAMHAPEVPGWFTPDVKPKPPWPERPEGLSERGHDLASKIAFGETRHIGVALAAGAITASEADALRDFEMAIAEATKAHAVHERMAMAERLVQWRWAYADLMLAGRERKP